MAHADSVIRYVLTYQKPGETRTLATAAQGRYTFATQKEAEAHLKSILANNSQATLENVGWVNLEVRPCPCYPCHFDPQTIYFED